MDTKAPENTEILKIKETGIESGFASLKARSDAWETIFEMKAFDKKTKPNPFIKDALSEDALEQIKFDVQRSFTLGSGSIFFDENKANIAKTRLESILIHIFSRNPHVSYTQGFNEIVSFFYLASCEKKAQKMSQIVLDRYYRDFLVSDLEQAEPVMAFVIEIIGRKNRKVYTKLKNANKSFLLPWLLTWFANGEKMITKIFRIYDFIVSTNFIMPFYIAAYKILQKAPLILKASDNQDQINQMLIGLWKNDEIDEDFAKVLSLYKKHPPLNVLKSMENSNITLLKTTALYENIKMAENVDDISMKVIFPVGRKKTPKILIYLKYGVPIILLISYIYYRAHGKQRQNVFISIDMNELCVDSANPKF